MCCIFPLLICAQQEAGRRLVAVQGTDGATWSEERAEARPPWLSGCLQGSGHEMRREQTQKWH